MVAYGDKTQYVVHVQLDAATAVDRCVWTCPADQSYRLVGYSSVHSTVGGASAAVRPRKVTGTSAPGAAAGATVKELSAAVDLTATINTVVRPTITATESERTFLPGDRLCLDASGTVSGLAGLNMVLAFEPVGRYI
jgi:hypothetical protein